MATTDPSNPTNSNTSLPTVPDYIGAAADTSGTTTIPNANDIWGLGALYGEPVLLGVDYPGNDNAERVGYKPGMTGMSQASDEFSKTQDMMSQLSDLYAQQGAERQKTPGATTAYEQLQMLLYYSGAYGSTAQKDVHFGQYDKATQDAMKQALNDYEVVTNVAKTPMTFADFLNQNATMGQDGKYNPKNASGSGAATQVQLSDPNQIKAAAQSAALAALGHGLTPDQLDKFVSQFQGQQSSDQLTTAPSATTPDLSAEAMTYAQSSDPVDFSNHNAQGYANALMNMLLPSSAVNRPSITPVASVTGGSE